MTVTDYIDLTNWGLLKWLLAAFISYVLFYDIFLVTRYKIRAKANGGGWIPVQKNFPLGIPPILRNLRALKRNAILEHLVGELAAFNRSTVAVEWTMSLNMFTRDSENVKSMLATDFKSYSLGNREKQLGGFLGPGIFTLSGSGWKHSRTMLRPQFSRDQVAQLESLDDHVTKLIARFDQNSNQFVDAQELFHKLTMDTATEFLFGESTESLSDTQCVVNGISAAQFIEDYNVALYWTLLRIFSGPLYPLVSPKAYRQAVARSRKFVEHFVDKALRATEKHVPGDDSASSYFFTHELAKVTRDKDVIRDQAFNVLLAGRDTTASLLSYTLWHLGKRPDVFAKLRETVIQEFGTDTSKISFESLKRCAYLRNIINEVLRLNPIVPRNSRTAIRDTYLPHGGGDDGSLPVFVPKGTMVTYFMYDIHRNPVYWGPDAHIFNPDRWNTPQSHGWEYLPFNGGPRICLGQQFALTEASFTLLRLAQEYERVELKNPDADLVNFARLTANVAGGVPVILQRPSEKTVF